MTGTSSPDPGRAIFLCGVCARGLEQLCNPASQLAHWNIFISGKRKKLDSAISVVALNYLMLLSSTQLCWSHHLQVTVRALISQKQPLSSRVLLCLKWQMMVVVMMMMRIAAVVVSILHSGSRYTGDTLCTEDKEKKKNTVVNK